MLYLPSLARASTAVRFAVSRPVLLFFGLMAPVIGKTIKKSSSLLPADPFFHRSFLVRSDAFPSGFPLFPYSSPSFFPRLTLYRVGVAFLLLNTLTTWAFRLRSGGDGFFWLRPSGSSFSWLPSFSFLLFFSSRGTIKTRCSPALSRFRTRRIPLPCHSPSLFAWLSSP